MKHFHQVARWGMSIGLAAAMAMMDARSASADLLKCSKKVEGQALKLMISKAKAFEKCVEAVRKAQGKNEPIGLKAAPACEKGLFKIYDLGGPAGKGAVNKFIASMNKLHPKTCTEADLTRLGHLVSGVNAPGARGPTCLPSGAPACTQDADCTTAGDYCPGAMEFAKTWIYKAKEKLAIKEMYFAEGDLRPVLDAAIDAQPDPSSGALGTFCGVGAPPAGFEARPNLCSLSPIFWPQCHDHACALSAASGAKLNPVGAPITLNARKVALEVCRLTNLPPLPILGPDYMVLINEPARTFSPPPVIPIVPAITACVDQLRSEGWCDCVGHGIPFAPSFCLDHVGTTPGPVNDDCGSPVAAATLESNCGCSRTQPGSLAVDPNTNPCKSTAGCDTCVNKTTGAPCHSGTSNGQLMQSWSSGSVMNSCVDVNTIQFKLLPPAVCVTAMGTAAGTCAAPGSPPAACVSVGGVVCLNAAGPDGVPCTSDDLVPANAPVVVPFTTGISNSTIFDSPQPVQGSCGGTTTTANMNCVTANDCGGATPTCSATLMPITFAAGPGNGVSCANLEASNLANWKIVGSFPALDGAGGIGDSVITFTLACQ